MAGSSFGTIFRLTTWGADRLMENRGLMGVAVPISDGYPLTGFHTVPECRKRCKHYTFPRLSQGFSD